jgi:hypothetical protein
MFYVFNKNYFQSEAYKNINPYLLFFIIDETFIYNSLKLIYSFIFAGSSHHVYNYNEDIPIQKLFPNNILTINSKSNSDFYLINYFANTVHDYILEHEPIIGKANIYFSNSVSFSKTIPEYLEKLNSYPIHFLNSSLIEGDYAIFKISCEQNNQNKILSYINLYKKNEVKDIINFTTQKTLLYIEKNKQYSFSFDSHLINDNFKIRIRILKKDDGEFNIELKYKCALLNRVKGGLRMSFVKYKLIIDASTIHAFFGEGFPFNIRKDLKKIEDIDDFKKNLLEAVACPDCPPQRCCISKIYIENKLIAFKKYRLTDGKKGKSGGYRCIVLYDEFH